MDYRLMRGDCLKRMNEIASGSVDLILCDLPYGTTNNKWDSIIPYEPLWAAYKRILKNGGAIILNSMQPFTTKLIASNFQDFKYCLYWQKNIATGFLNAKKQPLRNVEDICVFYDKQCTYNPIMIKSKKVIVRGANGNSSNYGVYHESPSVKAWEYFPRTLIKFNAEAKERGYHPTQKPVKLLEYLIKTYSNKGDLVLDNCMGSGSTGVAAMNTDRRFIGIEQEQKYYDIAVKRISRAHDARELALF